MRLSGGEWDWIIYMIIEIRRLVYRRLRNNFMCKLDNLFVDGFESLDSFKNEYFVLGSEL